LTFARHVHVKNVLGVRRPSGQHDDLIGEEDAFPEIMGDQEAGERLLRAQVMHGAPQVLAGEGVERAEGFVEDQDVGFVDDRPAEDAR
jgi:hypothetical protein